MPVETLSGWSKNKSARNLATAELIQCFVRFRKRTRRHLATYAAGRSHCQNLSDILSGADSGSLDPNLPCRHQDRRKADRIRRQAHH